MRIKFREIKFFFLLVLILFAFFSFFHFLPGIVMWDEAGYIWEGYRVHEALRAGNWQEFLKITQSQFYYPFFQSWFLGLTTIFLPYNFFTARLVSFLLIFPTALLIYQISLKISGKKSLASFLVLFFLFTSPLILYYYSTAMKEGLGTVLTLLAFWFYIKGREEKKLFWFFLSGLVSLILTLTKYNYGVLVLMVLGLEFFFWRRLKENLILFLPVFLVLAIWLSPSGRWQEFWLILQNRFTIHLYETTVIGHLLYYPLVLAFEYFFSPLVFLLAFLGFVYSFKWWPRDFRLRILGFLFLINFILAERHMGNNQGRFIFTSVPGFLVVASFGLEKILFLIFSFFKKIILRQTFLGGIFFSGFLIFGGVILKDLIFLPKILRPTVSHESDTAVFYEQDQYRSWRFDFTRDNWPHQYPDYQKQEKQEDVFKFIFSQVDLRKPVIPLNFTNEFSPLLFNFYFAVGQKAGWGIREDKYSSYFIVLEIKEGGMLDTVDFRKANLGTALQAKEFLISNREKKIAEKEFPTLGLTVHILATP
ncbi:MAG: ArnT family glycosyltransferase [Microgenomates group bacterium]